MPEQPTGTLDRIRAGVARHGPAGTLRVIGRRLQRFAAHRETYIWFELPLAGERPRLELAEGFELVAVGDAELDAFHTLGSTAPADTARYRAQGGQPWMVLGRGAPAFACWIHPRRTPLRVLPDGFLDLPATVGCLEDSVTSPDFRGQGVAPRAWSQLADHYQGLGFTSLVTKVLDENIPSCKAVGKAGFAEVARMHVSQTGPYVKLRMESGGTGSGPALVERLDGKSKLVRD